jgi:hypothetical protein
MLNSAGVSVRIHAARLAGRTPFRVPLADALCAELAKPSTLRDASLAATILSALPFLGTPDHRPRVERLILADGIPAAAAHSAAWGIGHVPGTSDDRFWWRAIRRHRSRLAQDRTPMSASILGGLVYSLGQAGHQDLLAQIRDDPVMPAAARTAAHWWTGLPTPIIRSARL